MRPIPRSRHHNACLSRCAEVRSRYYGFLGSPANVSQCPTGMDDLDSSCTLCCLVNCIQKLIRQFVVNVHDFISEQFLSGKLITTVMHLLLFLLLVLHYR